MNTSSDNDRVDRHPPANGTARDRATVLRDNLMRGLVAGVAGFVTVSLASMIHATVSSPEEGWLPMKLVAATWLGVGALIGGNLTVALGFATHLGVSMGWAVVLALLLGWRRAPVTNLVAGFLWGAVVVYFLMTWVVLPYLDPVMSARVATQPGWWWWLLHAIYGITLGVVLMMVDTGLRRRRA